MSLQCLFVVQGEGRGHLTQAMALRQMLATAGHHVSGVIVGKSPGRTVPTFFERAFEAPVTTVQSPGFVLDGKDRSVRPWATLGRVLRRLPTFWHALDRLEAALERHDPDVVVNFFEPLMGLYARHRRSGVPVVAVAHQYMFLHPEYSFPSGRRLQRWTTRTVARCAAWGAESRLALSLYPVADRPERNLTVVPPLLRQDVLQHAPGHREPFFLVYLLNRGYAEDILRWHEAHPDVPLHCFWDRPGAAPVEAYDDTLTFHRLDDRKFVEYLALCRGFVTTAGFESVAEAMYLGTPVQVVPVEGHFEQLCNAVDAVRARAGIRSAEFDVGRLQEYLPYVPAAAESFRAWVHRGRHRVVRTIEEAADTELPALRRSADSSRASVLDTAS